MRRIDFLGAAGAGKTTVFYELFSQKIGGDKYLSPIEAKIELKISHAREKKSFVAGLAASPLFKRVLHKNDLLKTICDLIAFKMSAPKSFLDVNFRDEKQKAGLWDARSEYEPLLNTVLKVADLKEKELILRIAGISNFYEVFRDVIELEKAESGHIVIFDESLSQKICGITEWRPGLYESITGDYFNSLPPPAGLVYFHLAPEEVFKRLKERGRLILSHHGLDDGRLSVKIKAQLDMADMGMRVLAERGVPVCLVDAKEEARVQAERIREFLSDNF